MKTIVFDLGGTNIRAGIVSDTGKIWGFKKFQITDNDKSEKGIILKLTEIISEFRRKYKIKYAGIAAPGFIDFKRAIIVSSPNYPEWKNFSLSGDLQHSAGLRVYLENDANAFAIGEGWKGGGKGFLNFAGITLGTGVGGGIILNREIWHGSDGSAGEVGHITVNPEGPKCNCGNYGCLEVYASATAIIREAKRRLITEELKNVAEKDIPIMVYNLAREGVTEAREILNQAGYYLGIAIAGLSSILNLDSVVIGGGLSNAWKFIYPAIMKELGYRLHPLPRRRLRVVRSKLGDRAALLGMARVVIKGIKRDDGDK